MKSYDVYLFDFDGTTFDTGRSLIPVFKAAFASVGMDCSEEQALHYMHLNALQTLQERKVPEALYPVYAKAIKEALDSPETIHANRPFPETLEVLRKLKEEGKRIAIVSGNTAHHIHLVLDHWGFPKDLCDCVVGSDMYQNGKPDPEPLLLALSLLKEEPGSATCYIGDSDQDIEAAHAAGVEAIFVSRTRHFDTPITPDFAISSLKDLL